MENAEAKGRFIVGHKAMHLSVVLQTIHENFHDLRVSNYLVLQSRYRNYFLKTGGSSWLST
jgi:hypothetical protein